MFILLSAYVPGPYISSVEITLGPKPQLCIYMDSCGIPRTKPRTINMPCFGAIEFTFFLGMVVYAIS